MQEKIIFEYIEFSDKVTNNLANLWITTIMTLALLDTNATMPLFNKDPILAV